jgi:hypothetical protein
MDRMLMDAAATNFDAAQYLTGPQQMQRICLGLTQVARAMTNGSRDPLLINAAANNFDTAASEPEERQLQLMCMGLMQYARSV